MSNDPQTERRARRTGFVVAYISFVFFCGLLVAKFGLLGLLVGGLPAAVGAALAGYGFYRSPLLCALLEAILLGVAFWP